MVAHSRAHSDWVELVQPARLELPLLDPQVARDRRREAPYDSATSKEGPGVMPPGPSFVVERFYGACEPTPQLAARNACSVSPRPAAEWA